MDAAKTERVLALMSRTGKGVVAAIKGGRGAGVEEDVEGGEGGYDDGYLEMDGLTIR